MKKLIFILLLFTTLESSACEICGCANGGSFFGVLPQSHMRFMGLRYTAKSYNSHVTSKALGTTENFQSIELWGRIYPVNKVQMLFFVPYHFNAQTRDADGYTAKKSGVGDITVLAHYNLINTFMDSLRLMSPWQHNLLIGGGIKLPTGAFEYDAYNVEEVANANFQLGTGSFDFPVNLIYTIKYNEAGLNMNLTHKLNRNNSQDYRFANRTNLALTAFAMKYIGNVMLMPTLGATGEFAKQDLINGERNEHTGGYFVNGTLGTDIYAGTYSIGFSAKIPLTQNLSNKELVLNKTFGVRLTKMF